MMGEPGFSEPIRDCRCHSNKTGLVSVVECGDSLGDKDVVWINMLEIERTTTRDFPGGAVVKNLPANVGDMGSSPGPGRSHMQLSPCATATESEL